MNLQASAATAGLEPEFRVATLSDIVEIERTPLLERLPSTDIYEALHLSAQRHADAIALRFLPDAELDTLPLEITYRDLMYRIHQAANLFHALGVTRERPVSYLLSNLPETHYAIWGGEVAGVVNGINPFLETAHIATLLRAAHSVVLVVQDHAETWKKLPVLLPQVPDVHTVLVVSGDPLCIQRPELPDTVHWLMFNEQLMAQRSDQLTFARHANSLDSVALFHTGGTTGTPKLAPQHSLGQVYVGWCFGRTLNLGECDNFFCGLPLFHVNGVVLTGIMPFLSGATVTLLTPEGFRNKLVVRNFWKLVEKYRATTFSTVPTMISALLEVPLEADIASLKHVLCGAAPMSVEAFRRFQDKTGVAILEGYGLTESHCVATASPRCGEHRIGSVGLRFPYQQLKTVVLDDQGAYLRDAATNEVGVVMLKGPNVFAGYLESGNRAESFIDGWFNTGDLGRLDAEGYLWLTGRAKDLIIRSGHNIDPAVTEEALMQHPAVLLAAAVGCPDAHAGELPVAYVQLRPGANVSNEALLAFAREHVSERAAAPAWVEIVEAIPLTAVGKLTKVELRRRAVVRGIQTALHAAGIDAVLRILTTDGALDCVQITVHENELECAESIMAKFTLSYRLLTRAN